VPLSEHEKKTLAEMEAALAAEDPRLVSTLTAKPRTPRSLTIVRGAVLFLIGMITLIVGLVAKYPIVSIGGFILALIGVFGAVSSSSRNSGSVVGGSKSANKKSASKKGKFSDRMQRRWEERN